MLEVKIYVRNFHAVILKSHNQIDSIIEQKNEVKILK